MKRERRHLFDLIIEYTNLLHKHSDPNAPEVQAFIAQHNEDSVLIQRIKILNRVFQLKEDQLNKLIDELLNRIDDTVIE